MEMAERMAALNEAYADYLRVACSETEIAQGDHPTYLWHDAKVAWLRTEVYGEVLAEFAQEWMDDCNEVPSVRELTERWMGDRIWELKDAAVRAAHASDVDWDGRCTKESKDAVAEKFQKMVELMDLIQTVDPERRREETLALAMVHAMKEKALDYGVEVK
jgi:hypothetical protein